MPSNCRVRFCPSENFVKRLAAMADFHHRHANARKTQHVALRFLQHGNRKNGGAGAEIVNSFGHCFLRKS